MHLLTHAADVIRDGTVRLEAGRTPQAILITVLHQGPSRIPEGDGAPALALALSARLCEAMGARLTSESVLPEGIVFTISLPAAEAAGARP